jgi:hypothetical protein
VSRKVNQVVLVHKDAVAFAALRRSSACWLQMSAFLAWPAFVLGGSLCVLNFYLSFVSYPVHRLRGRSKESYRWVSGIPLVGSILVVLSLLHLHSLTALFAIGVALIAIDTAGIHWFVGTMIYQSFSRKRNGQQTGKD